MDYKKKGKYFAVDSRLLAVRLVKRLYVEDRARLLEARRQIYGIIPIRKAGHAAEQGEIVTILVPVLALLAALVLGLNLAINIT